MSKSMTRKDVIRKMKETIKEISEGLEKDSDEYDFINEYFLYWDGYLLGISYGGPTEGFKIARNKDNDIAEIRYYYYDGPSDGEEIYARDYLTDEEYSVLEDLYYGYLKE